MSNAFMCDRCCEFSKGNPVRFCAGERAMRFTKDPDYYLVADLCTECNTEIRTTLESMIDDGEER